MSNVATKFKTDDALDLDLQKGVIKPGNVCVVTGASRGIGKEIALALAAAGQCKVVINHIPNEKDEAEGVLKAIESLGCEAVRVEGSISDPKDVKRMMDTAVEKWGTVDVLVNNAAIMFEDSVLDVSLDDWKTVIDTNLTGTWMMCQAALKIMEKAKKGRIVNIASVVGLRGSGKKVHYAATKGGIMSMTKSIASSFAEHGITCNAVSPGYVDTPMLPAQDPKSIEKIPEKVPLGRAAHPGEVAGLVRYLALDPSAAYITGHIVPIDGGLFMN